MRHFGTAIASLIIAPVAWLLLAMGQARSLKAFDSQPGTLGSAHFLQPLLLLAGAGLLLGILATLRFSPLGAVLTGLLYLVPYVLLLVSPQRVVDALPQNVSVAGLHADATTPLRTGTAALVGAMMVLSLFSGGRWRRWPNDEDTGYWGGGSYGSSSTSDDYSTTRVDPWSDLAAPQQRQPSNLMGWATALRR
jgi:hypothetical protein